MAACNRISLHKSVELILYQPAGQMKSRLKVKGTGRGFTVNCWINDICKKNIRRTENSEVTNFKLYISTEWNFTTEDSVKLTDLLSVYNIEICGEITPFFKLRL